MPINRVCIGAKNLLAVLLEVVELAAVERPGEHGEDGQHEDGGHGNEQVQDVHRVSAREAQ